MPTCPPPNQEHAVLISSFELAFIISVRWVDDEIGGWMWAAEAEDNVGFATVGRTRDLTPERALAAAINTLTNYFD